MERGNKDGLIMHIRSGSLLVVGGDVHWKKTTHGQKCDPANQVLGCFSTNKKGSWSTKMPSV